MSAAESAAFVRRVTAMRAWQVRNVAAALAVRRARSKAGTAVGIVEVFEDPARRHEAEKAVEAVSRGIKRPGIVRSLHDAFDAAACDPRDPRDM